MQVESLGGKIYVFVSVDDCSRVKFLKEKSYTFTVFEALAINLVREKEQSLF